MHFNVFIVVSPTDTQQLWGQNVQPKNKFLTLMYTEKRLEKTGISALIKKEISACPPE